MPFKIIRQDITNMEVDAIVNAANTELKMGSGVCGAIFKKAGPKQMQAACDKLAPIKTGEAVITPGFDLPAKYVIHTAGPVYRRYDPEGSERLLRSAYTQSLKLAVENNLESIAFPLISSGIFGYPKDEALQVATSAIRDFLEDYDLDVQLVLFDKSAFVISRELLGEVESYINDNYVDKHREVGRSLLNVERRAMRRAKHTYMELISLESEDMAAGAPVLDEKPSYTPQEAAVPLENLLEDLDEPFSDFLFRLIDSKGMTDVEVYKRANLDRRLFNKIKNVAGYMPGKRTVLSLAIALQLSLEETNALLKRAGYALSRAVKFDVIVEFFIVSGNYDIFTINEVLFEYDQPFLGS